MKAIRRTAALALALMLLTVCWSAAAQAKTLRLNYAKANLQVGKTGVLKAKVNPSGLEQLRPQRGHGKPKRPGDRGIGGHGGDYRSIGEPERPMRCDGKTGEDHQGGPVRQQKERVPEPADPSAYRYGEAQRGGRLQSRLEELQYRRSHSR